MAALGAVFILQQINDVYLRLPIYDWLALSPDGLAHGRIWQLLTYQFLHGGAGLGLFHIACNLIGLWFFGRYVEQRLGRKTFWGVYLAGGTAGGLLQAALGWVFPAHFGNAVVGASAGVCALLAVFALLETEAFILVFFVLPMRAVTLFYVMLGVEFFFTVVPSDRGIAHPAHLAGLLCGWVFVRKWQGLRRAWTSRTAFRRVPGRRKAAVFRGSPPETGAGEIRLRRTEDARMENLPPAEFISREVDPILDKISAHGIHSLTERERQILEKARRKMGGR